MSVSGRLVREERGVAIALAVSVLALILMLVLVLLAATIQAGNSATRGSDAKRALAAAEAGMQIARYRLNKIDPANDKCLTDQPVATGSSGAAPGECPPATASVGNGDSYSYYVTPSLSVGTACAGTTVPSSSATPIQRCITSVGTAGGVSRRLESLVTAASASSPLFARSGMLGLSGIDITENSFGDITGHVATNGVFKLKGCKTAGSASNIDFAPGPSGSINNTCSGTPTVQPAAATPWTASSLDPLIGTPNTALAANNDNATVFGSAAGFSYTSATRVLKDTADATLTLNGPNPRSGSGGYWVFNLCEVTLSHSTSIVLVSGAKARFFIDSFSRSGSGCANDSKLSITNVSYLNYNPSATPPGDPAALQILYYGAAQISISNQSGFSGALYAPNATVKFTNKTTWYGAITADTITATNGLAFTEGDVSSITNPGSGSGSGTTGFTRTAWEECPSTPTSSSDPESGC